MLVPTNEAIVIIDSGGVVCGFSIQNIDPANAIWVSPSQEGLNRMPTATPGGGLGLPATGAPGDDVDAIDILPNGGSWSPPVPFVGKMYARALNANAVIRKIQWRATLP